MTITKIFIITLIAGIVLTGIRSVFEKPQSWVVSILKNFVGAFLIFSGAVKAVDPLGTSYKMHDYFVAFGGIFTSLDPITTPLAVFMIVLELILGVALIIGYQKKLTVWLTMLMIIFFTFLTGYTYLNGYINPDRNDPEVIAAAKEAGESVPFIVPFDANNMKVTDCGCFGDFLKLEPKISFFKDLILIVVIAIIILGMRHITPWFKNGALGHGLMAGLTVLSLLFCFKNYVWGLPMADFRPYKVGNNIPEQRTAEKEPVVEYQFKYRNEETGEVKMFDMDNLPSAPWKWQDRIENVIDPGIPAKINNFYVENEEGIEISDEILSNSDYSFWVVAYNLEKTNKKAFIEKINPLAAEVETAGYDIFVLAADANDAFRHDVQAAYPFYRGDETFFKTIIRSNPGLMIVKDGTVIAKFHHRHIPDFSEIQRDYLK